MAKAKTRSPLSKERVLRAAIRLADKDIDSLSMRKLGQELGVEAMSLYNHVANKDEVLDGIVALVVSEIEPPPEGTDWDFDDEEEMKKHFPKLCHLYLIPADGKEEE